MKVAILSDIHSNLEAMIACCRKARAVGVKRYVCLGDMVGYGADPIAVLDLLINLPNLIAVRGNHDEAVVTGEFTGTNGSIQQVFEWTRNKLLDRHRQFLQSLPYVQTEYGAVFAHASVNNPKSWEYLYHIVAVRNCLLTAPNPLVFTGHTHLPVLYYETPAGGIKQLAVEDGQAIALYQGRRYFVNVGSVGQPRDGSNTACFVVFDTALQELTFHRVPYDYTVTAKKIIKAGFDPHFATRLAGREQGP